MSLVYRVRDKTTNCPVYFLKILEIFSELVNSHYTFFSFTFGIIYTVRSEKALAPHSSTLAWEIPWTEEPGRLQSMGSLRVGHD